MACDKISKQRQLKSVLLGKCVEVHKTPKTQFSLEQADIEEISQEL